MKLWQIALITILSIGLIIYFETKNTLPQQTPIFVFSDIKQLEKKAEDSHKSADSSRKVANQTIINTKPVIKKYHDKDKTIVTLNADSSLKLFTKWNKQIDSIGERYFCLNTDTLYNQLK
jgi:hypothetical protein